MFPTITKQRGMVLVVGSQLHDQKSFYFLIRGRIKQNQYLLCLIKKRCYPNGILSQYRLIG